MFSVCKVLELDDNAAKETPEISRAKAMVLMLAEMSKVEITTLYWTNESHTKSMQPVRKISTSLMQLTKKEPANITKTIKMRKM